MKPPRQPLVRLDGRSVLLQQADLGLAAAQVVLGSEPEVTHPSGLRPLKVKKQTSGTLPAYVA